MITIIKAKANDFEIIKDLAYRIWPDTYGAILSKQQLTFMLGAFYSVATLKDNVQNKGHHFLLVLDANKHVGFASYEHNYQRKLVTRLHKIYLLPEMQGKGIGKLIIDRVVAIAIQNKMTFISLNVNRSNKALTFYQKLGFKIISEEDIELDHGYMMEDYVMELQLTYKLE